MSAEFSFTEAADAILLAGQRLHARGWVPATAGNLSVRLPSAGGTRIAITRSGVHKGFLRRSDVIVVDGNGVPENGTARPSAETLLHCQLYARFPGAGAVLHGHSVAGTVLSMAGGEAGGAIRFTGYEVQKVFAGQADHLCTAELPVVANDQDMERLAQAVAPRLSPEPMGYLIRGHGTYVWAPDMDAALARFEGLEFLLDCELERRRLP